jgi:hypothetical protein
MMPKNGQPLYDLDIMMRPVAALQGSSVAGANVLPQKGPGTPGNWEAAAYWQSPALGTNQGLGRIATLKNPWESVWPLFRTIHKCGLAEGSLVEGFHPAHEKALPRAAPWGVGCAYVWIKIINYFHDH